MYKLDLTKEEYRDDYVVGQDGEFWQDVARSALLGNLKSILKDAREYKRYRDSQQRTNHKTWLSHNAILVTSPRGSGKTVFLRNCEVMWAYGVKEESGSQNPAIHDSDLFFLDVIDPTMLMSNDSFANVIIAQIYQAVRERLNQQACCDESSQRRRDKFHQNLKDLADSLGKNTEFNGCTGIDKILKYSSGIQVEDRFHRFVESAIEVLGCQAMVVSIDDVDMALDRAFEVVDDVRRFLGCPYIIPVVSGDLQLYEHMTQVHFDARAYDNSCKDEVLREDGRKLSKSLADAYLTKVFPSPMRITLFPINKIIPTLKLTIIPGSSEELEYGLYEEKICHKFYYLCNNRDARKSWPTPETARELTQLVRAIKPEDVGSIELDKIGKIQSWIGFKNWAELKKSGEAFAIAESVLTLLQRDVKELFDIQNLLAFNPKMQLDVVLYPWANYSLFEPQKEALIRASRGKNQKNSKSGKENIELNQKALESIFGETKMSLKSMPPFEFISDQLYVSSKSPIEGNNDISLYGFDCENGTIGSFELSKQDAGKVNAASMLLDIYTHDEIYTSLNNARKFVFFSRAFEILFYSVVGFHEETLLSDIEYILKRKPFYSFVNIGGSKVAVHDEGDESDESDSMIELEEMFEYYDYCEKPLRIRVLCLWINDWRKANKSLFECIPNESLVALFSYCFNGTFTAMQIVRENYIQDTVDGYRDEHLSDMANRFKYILLNSLLRAGVCGEAIYANVATGAKSKRLRKEREFLKTDRTYYRNLNAIEDEIGNFSPNRLSLLSGKVIKDLHDAVKSHPIFKLLENPDGCGVLRLGPVGSAGISRDNQGLTWDDVLNNLDFSVSFNESIKFFLHHALKGNVVDKGKIKSKLEKIDFNIPEVDGHFRSIADYPKPTGWESRLSDSSKERKVKNIIKAFDEMYK